MPNFHQHPDGLIFVRGETEEFYIDTPENFEADYGFPLPALPEGMTERFYEPGIRHFFSNNSDSFPAPELVWGWGDTVITSLRSLLVVQQARKENPSTE